jgi:sec-independent protein translocase protein TatA
MLNTLLFFNISGGEIFIILIVVFIVFGPQKIPEIARKLGKGLHEMKKATSDIKREINNEVNKVKTDVDDAKAEIDDTLKNIDKKEKSDKTNN